MTGLYYRSWVASIAALLAIVLATSVDQSLISITAAGDEPTPIATKPAAGLPPLVIDRGTPLLLDDPAPPEDREDASFLLINDACFVCHNNYKEEAMAVAHAREGVGCIDCHGKSLAHRNDEDNITPPDVMYPLEKVDEACQDCHDSHDVWPKDILTRWLERCPEKTQFSELTCTDCHGQHRLTRRVVRWDKHTGELLVRPTNLTQATPPPSSERASD